MIRHSRTFFNVLLCTAFVLAGAFAFGQQAGPSFTVDGVAYTDVHFGERHGDTVDIFHSTGVANVPMEKLPPEIQKRLGYRSKKSAPPPRTAPPKTSAPKPTVRKTSAPAPKPPTPKPPETKPAAQKPAEEKTSEEETSEPKSNIEKLTLEKPEEEEPAAEQAPPEKSPAPEVPAKKPVEPVIVRKSPVEKPVAPKPVAEKPPIRKISRQQAFARKPRAMEVPSKTEAERWLQENEKKVWSEVWANYDQAAQEASVRYNTTDDEERWRDYQEKLWSEHNEDLCKKLGITPAMQQDLMEKGYREDWPVEKSPEDKAKISNEAGAKPVSDEADGAVAEVVSYLQDKLGAADTVEYLRWYPPLLEETNKGYAWAVEVKYWAQGADGKTVVETGTAYLRHNKVADFKSKPGK